MVEWRLHQSHKIWVYLMQCMEKNWYHCKLKNKYRKTQPPEILIFLNKDLNNIVAKLKIALSQ